MVPELTRSFTHFPMWIPFSELKPKDLTRQKLRAIVNPSVSIIRRQFQSLCFCSNYLTRCRPSLMCCKITVKYDATNWWSLTLFGFSVYLPETSDLDYVEGDFPGSNNRPPQSGPPAVPSTSGFGDDTFNPNFGSFFNENVFNPFPNFGGLGFGAFGAYKPWHKGWAKYFHNFLSR